MVLREPGTETSEFFPFSLEQEVSNNLHGSNSLDSTVSQNSNALSAFLKASAIDLISSLVTSRAKGGVAQ